MLRQPTRGTVDGVHPRHPEVTLSVTQFLSNAILQVVAIRLPRSAEWRSLESLPV